MAKKQLFQYEYQISSNSSNTQYLNDLSAVMEYSYVFDEYGCDFHSYNSFLSLFYMLFITDHILVHLLTKDTISSRYYWTQVQLKP